MGTKRKQKNVKNHVINPFPKSYKWDVKKSQGKSKMAYKSKRVLL